MAGSYVLPQVQVFQEFAQTPDDVTQKLNPFVFGPRYHLIRYSEPDERPDCAHGGYTGAELSIGWSENAPTGSKVDPSYAKVDFVDVYCAIPLNNGGADGPLSASVIGGTVVEFTGLTASAQLSGDGRKFYRDIRPGDYLMFTEGSKPRFTKIRSVGYGTLDEASTSTDSDYEIKTSAATGISVDASEYYGENPGRINLTVTKSGETYSATWSTSIVGINNRKTPLQLAVSEGNVSIDFGKGLTATVATTSVASGTFSGTIDIEVKYDTSHPIVNSVTVVDTIPNDTSSFTICTKVDKASIPAVRNGNVQWTADMLGVTINQSITIPLAEFDGLETTVSGATAYVTQRSLVTSDADTIHTISQTSDIIKLLGKIHPDNPLAYGVYMAKLNSADIPVYYMGVPHASIEAESIVLDWAKVLDKATNTNDVYAFAPMTDDKSVLDLVQGHINEMSTPTEKSWRIGFVSAAYDSTVDRTPDPADGSKTKIRIMWAAHDACLTAKCFDTQDTTSTWSRFVDTLAPGDELRVYNGAINGDGSKAYDAYTIVEVKSNTELLLGTTYRNNAGADVVQSTATVNTNPPAHDYAVIHRYTQAEAAEAMAEISANFYDRRMYNVWPGEAYSAGTLVKGYFLAAAVAGLACSVQPQQPITNVEIKGIDDIPQTHTNFTREQLNTIAAGGTLIIMQDLPGSTAYVRHQISTRYRDGNLNTTELSLVKNLDSISFYFANRFAPYNGRYNITPDLITEIDAIISHGLSYLATATMTNPLIGPQIIDDGTEIVNIMQHPTLKDTAMATVSLNLPKPFNNFNLTLYVI